MKNRRIRIRRAAAVLLTGAMSVNMVSAPLYAEALEETETLGAYEAETEGASADDYSGVVSDSPQTEADTSVPTVSSETMPFYFYDMDNRFDYPVYFINDVKDLPYVNLSDWVEIMTGMLGGDEEPYNLELETDGSVAMVTRENGFSMVIDFENPSIIFEDYDLFVHYGDKSLIDMVSSGYSDENGDPVLIERIEKGSFDRNGKELELDLAAYQIPLYWSADDDLYLIPMQTLSDFLSAPTMKQLFLYNTTAVYVTDSTALGIESGELTPMGESYLSAPADYLSDDLAWYSYCELCLALDNLYGLKEIHDISSFDNIFTYTGYKSDLTSNDPNVKDGALDDFINYYLDDFHSGFTFASYRTEELQEIGGGGLSLRRDNDVSEIYLSARNNAGHAVKAYEEVGNTAYITFDHFTMTKYADEYYTMPEDLEMDPSSETLETPDLITYAHKQITRENSPIENVVVDLSLNGGGAVDAGAAIAAWFLGEASMSIRSSMTGAISTGTYRFDANLDGAFNDDDTVKDKNLFCIIGPYSFSCGNLVPNLYKSSGRVTLLGRQSGGGSCSVLPMSTAYGTLFNISSPNRMSFLKNGSYYDTDTGIEPDCVIVRPESFYDREGLTEYINNLF